MRDERLGEAAYLCKAVLSDEGVYLAKVGGSEVARLALAEPLERADDGVHRHTSVEWMVLIGREDLGEVGDACADLDEAKTIRLAQLPRGRRIELTRRGALVRRAKNADDDGRARIAEESVERLRGLNLGRRRAGTLSDEVDQTVGVDARVRRQRGGFAVHEELVCVRILGAVLAQELLAVGIVLFLLEVDEEERHLVVVQLVYSVRRLVEGLAIRVALADVLFRRRHKECEDQVLRLDAPAELVESDAEGWRPPLLLGAVLRLEHDLAALAVGRDRAFANLHALHLLVASELAQGIGLRGVDRRRVQWDLDLVRLWLCLLLLAGGGRVGEEEERDEDQLMDCHRLLFAWQCLASLKLWRVGHLT